MKLQKNVDKDGDVNEVTEKLTDQKLENGDVETGMQYKVTE